MTPPFLVSIPSERHWPCCFPPRKLRGLFGKLSPRTRSLSPPSPFSLSSFFLPRNPAYSRCPRFQSSGERLSSLLTEGHRSLPQRRGFDGDRGRERRCIDDPCRRPRSGLHTSRIRPSIVSVNRRARRSTTRSSATRRMRSSTRSTRSAILPGVATERGGKKNRKNQ